MLGLITSHYLSHDLEIWRGLSIPYATLCDFRKRFHLVGEQLV